MKKLVIYLAAAGMACVLAGCGAEKKEVPSQGTEIRQDTGTRQEGDALEVSASGQFSEGDEKGRINVSDLQVEDYVTLGDYRNLKVSVDEAAEVTKEQVEEQALRIYQNCVTEENGGVTDRAVALGDTVIIDYVGKKDGVAFEGGTAKGASLGIGSGRFIDGFEDGLIGAMPGETLDLELTFPKEYDNQELAGADVVFTVTVHYILPVEMQDKVVAGFGREDYGSVEELKQYVRVAMEEDAEAAYLDSLKAALAEAVVNGCTFKALPEGLAAQYEQKVRENIERIASLYGVDGDTFCLYFYQTGLDDYAALAGEDSARQILAFWAIAEKEGLLLSEEELEKELTDLALDNGWASLDELLSQYDREELRESLLAETVAEYLLGNVQ